MSDTTTVRVIRTVQRKLASMCKLRGITVQVGATEAFQDKIEQWQHGGIFFYCTRCGKRMWEEVNWDEIKDQTLEAIKPVLICSDCLLVEVQAAEELEWK